MIAAINNRLYNSHVNNVRFKAAIKNVERLSKKNGVRYAVYFDKLLKTYSWIDTYENFILKNKVPQSDIICEIDFED
jgi:hypothetical protein